MTSFDFSTSQQIRFGRGAFKDIGNFVIEHGQRLLLVHGRRASWVPELEDSLDRALIEIHHFMVASEPNTTIIREGTTLAQEHHCDVIVGLGGGSVLDAAKAISAMARNPGDILDYLEVVGRGEKLRKTPIPVIAVPTTSGTGTEVTKNAVILSPEHKMKVSLRSPMMIPKVALVDPELTRTLPPEVTASTGMDALVQLIEPYVSPRANPITDGFCREGLKRISRSLLRAYRDGEDMQAREDMSLASLLGGLAFANAGLGAVHGFASPVGGMFECSHGAVCASLLVSVTQVNIQALNQRDPSSQTIARYEEIARLITGNPKATIEEGIEWMRRLVGDLGIPGLGGLGISVADIPTIVNLAAQASSMKANPILLSKEELSEILVKAL